MHYEPLFFTKTRSQSHLSLLGPFCSGSERTMVGGANLKPGGGAKGAIWAMIRLKNTNMRKVTALTSIEPHPIDLNRILIITRLLFTSTTHLYYLNNTVYVIMSPLGSGLLSPDTHLSQLWVIPLLRCFFSEA